MATVTVRNGINVDQLVATIGAINEQPSVSTFTFRAATSWHDGTLNRAEIGSFIHNGKLVERPEPFRLLGDEPPVLLGANRGPNAVELVLAALGFCYGVGFVANAAARG
ncbi:MAG TPA: OsmC family peroxiredoxin, partial [Candidatus Limnocylindria bacterium]|nr:OsmC family peroxiredoxin [Candidatus Limnocylindria bacterium]